MNDTLHALAEAHLPDTRPASAEEATASKIAECDRKLAQYRAALDAGANPATVAGWIAETEAEKASWALVMLRPEPRTGLTEQRSGPSLKSSPTSRESRSTPTRPQG